MSGPSENPLKRLVGEIHRRSLWQVLGIYAVASWIVFEVVQTLTEGLGLPDWFPALAFVLLLIGLPIVLATAFVQDGGPARPTADAPLIDAAGHEIGHQEAAPDSLSTVRRVFTWRNAITGGVLAFALWGVVAAGWVLVEARPPGGEGADAHTVAVLPLENLSPDPDNAYFADGIHEEILSQLAKIGTPKVISRTSVMGYRETTKSMPTIADELGVRHILEGTVRRAGDRVRITTQLINARSDEHLWAETYEREYSVSSVFDIQSEIAREIAGALEATLSPEEEARVGRMPTESEEAYDLYLRALDIQAGSGMDFETSQQAIELYDRAIAVDPTFALAYARRGIREVNLYWLGYNRSEERRRRGCASAESALALDPDLPEAHLAMGHCHYQGRRDYERALEEFEIARQGLPNAGDVLVQTAWVQRRMGRWEESLPTMERAVELDPRNPRDLTNLALSYAMLGRFEDAQRLLARRASLAP